jgi:hypothetical protein
MPLLEVTIAFAKPNAAVLHIDERHTYCRAPHLLVGSWAARPAPLWQSQVAVCDE